MPPDALLPWIAKAGDEARRAARVATADLARWDALVIDGAAPGFLTALQEGEWSRLSKQAASAAVSYRKDLAKLGQWQSRVGKLFERRQGLSGIATTGGRISDHPDWASVKTRLVAQLENEGLSKKDVSSALESLVAVDRDRFGDSFERIARSHAGRIDTYARALIRDLVASDLAMRIADLQRLAGASPRAGAVTIAGCRKRLTEAGRALYRAFRSRDAGGREAAARRLADQARSLMEQAMPAVASMTHAGRDRRTTASFARAGRNSLDGGVLVHELCAGIVCGEYAAWIARWPSSSGLAEAWVRAAAALPYAATSKPRKAASIERLQAEPDAHDGDEITIEGEIGAPQCVAAAPKPLCCATVADQRGAAVTITSPVPGFAMSGIGAGTYVRVSGVWRAHATGLTGPALEVAEPAAAAPRTWSEWTALDLAPSYSIAPRALRISWSWEPGRAGAANVLRYGCWYSKGGQ